MPNHLRELRNAIVKSEVDTEVETTTTENSAFRNQFIQENFNNIVEQLVAATTIPGNPDFEMFTNEDNVFKKC